MVLICRGFCLQVAQSSPDSLVIVLAWPVGDVLFRLSTGMERRPGLAVIVRRVRAGMVVAIFDGGLFHSSASAPSLAAHTGKTEHRCTVERRHPSPVQATQGSRGAYYAGVSRLAADFAAVWGVPEKPACWHIPCWGIMMACPITARKPARNIGLASLWSAGA